MSLETPPAIRRLQRKLYDKAKREPAFRFFQLYDKVYREDILGHAYRLVRANGGAPGVDAMTFAAIEAAGLEEWLAGLREVLRNKTYEPDPVRRVMIPKPGGGERPLGIPTIRDRVVQTAVKLVLEPIFEADFEDSAYGYRPRRSAQDAVAKVHEALCEGYTDVVDADLSQYFDTIPHRELMRSVARRIVERAMLTLIQGWLKVVVEERDEQGRPRLSGGKHSTAGTPQGGVISPLLANIYMHRFLRAWRERGKATQYRAKLINYADDFVILSRGNAEQALTWTRWAMAELGLTLNEAKTCIREARRESFTFLGYTFGPMVYHQTGRRYLGAQPSKKAIERVKGRVREILHPGNQAPWPQVAARVNRVLRGWANYFRYGSRRLAYRAVEGYVEERARHFLRRRHQMIGQGHRRFSGRQIFGELGIWRPQVPSTA
jgi:RNA-directed DNA polymerase